MRSPRQTEANVTRKPAVRKGKSPQRQTAKSNLRLEHGRHLRAGVPIGPLNLPGLAGFFNWPDSVLLKFVAGWIAENGSMFPDHMPKKGGEDFLCPLAELALAEAVMIARVIRKTPDAEMFTFPLPGVAGLRPVTPNHAMHYLASIWCLHHETWQSMGWLPSVRFAHERRAADQFEYAQVTIVCETWLCRAGVMESIDYEGAAHKAASRHYAAALQTAARDGLQKGAA